MSRTTGDACSSSPANPCCLALGHSQTEGACGDSGGVDVNGEGEREAETTGSKEGVEERKEGQRVVGVEEGRIYCALLAQGELWFHGQHPSCLADGFALQHPGKWTT